MSAVLPEHSPTPWFGAEDGLIFDADRECVCVVGDPDHCLMPRGRADMALLLAAPDMLLALKVIKALRPRRIADLTVAAAWSTVDACIDKAEGRS